MVGLGNWINFGGNWVGIDVLFGFWIVDWFVVVVFVLGIGVGFVGGKIFFEIFCVLEVEVGSGFDVRCLFVGGFEVLFFNKDNWFLELLLFLKLRLFKLNELNFFLFGFLGSFLMRMIIIDCCWLV